MPAGMRLPDGTIDHDRVVRHVLGRLSQAPRFRQKLAFVIGRIRTKNSVLPLVLPLRHGQITVYSPHTTTSIAVNESETGFLNDLRRLLTSVEKRRLSTGAEYRRILPRTAVRELRRGRDAYDANPTTESLANPWPRNRALIDFVLDRFDGSGE